MSASKGKDAIFTLQLASPVAGRDVEHQVPGRPRRACKSAHTSPFSLAVVRYGALASLASVPASVYSTTAGFDVLIYLFYAVAIIGVLFGPLLGLLPARWHGVCSARQLAIARIILMATFLQLDNQSPGDLCAGYWWLDRLGPQPPQGATGASCGVTAPGRVMPDTGLPAWTGVVKWTVEALTVPRWQHYLKLLAALAALCGVMARPALFVVAMVHVRENALRQSLHGDQPVKVDMAWHCWFPVMVTFALAPCADDLCLGSLIRCTPRPRAARSRQEYALPFTAAMLLVATTYLTAGLAKLTNCRHMPTGHWYSSDFWKTTHLRDMLHQSYFRYCQGATCLEPSNAVWRPLCASELAGLWHWLRGRAQRPALHAACVLGDNYLFPSLRPDQRLSPWMLQLAAFGAVAWELTMWLAVLRPGLLRGMYIVSGFMFHQSVRWLMSITTFYEQQDLYLIFVALLFTPRKEVYTLIAPEDGSDHSASDEECTPLTRTRPPKVCSGRAAGQKDTPGGALPYGLVLTVYCSCMLKHAVA